MIYVTYEWVMSHVSESYHICRNHVTHMYIRRVDAFCHTHAYVLSHIYMSHVTCMHEPSHTYELVPNCSMWVAVALDFRMPHICMSPVIFMYESCHTYAWVMSYVCMSHVTHMHRCLTRECLYGVAMIRRLLKIIGFFYRISSLL